MKPRNLVARTILAIGAAMLAALPAQAREPGVSPTIPPGATMGVPIGASPPPGLYFSSRSGYSDTRLKDGNGNDLGADVTIKDTALQFVHVPGIKLWGGDYKAMVLVPYLHLDQSLSAPLGSGNARDGAIGNVEIRPLDLSWQIEPGVFVSAGFSIHAPTGQWEASEPISTGGNFWTIAPSLGFSYLRDGWNASAHALWFTNTRNKDNDYRSGDEIGVNLTLFKDVGGVQIGPVAYYRQQIAEDDNDGAAYGGAVQGKAKQLALGLGVPRNFGGTEVNVIYTRDGIAENTPGGKRLWLNVTLPLTK